MPIITIVLITASLKITSWSQTGVVAGWFILVALSSFALMALLTGHLRFQYYAHYVQNHPESDDYAVFRLARRMAIGSAHAPFCLVLFDVNRDVAAGLALKQTLRSLVRRGDDLVLLNEARLLLIADLDPTHLAALMFRAGAVPGVCDWGFAAWPEHGDAPRRLLDQVERELAQGPGAPFPCPKTTGDPLPAEPGSLPPYIEPETGLLRAAETKKSLRRLLDDYKRSDRSAVLLALTPDNPRAPLRQVSALIQAQLRSGDFLGRGPDRLFYICLSEDQDHAQRIVVRLRQAGEQRKCPLHIVLKICPQDGEQFERLLANAHEALGLIP